MIIHLVEKGDTIWQIAQKYGLSSKRIISDNAIVNPSNLVVGQALLILKPRLTYVVQPGDTLTSIAQNFNTTPIKLVQNNPNLIFSPTIWPGQHLTIFFETLKQQDIVINAYAYDYIRPDVLKRALPYLTYLTIFGYGITETGDLIGINDQPLIDLAYKYQTAPVMLLSSITEDGTFSGQRASMLFNDPELQNKVLANIVETMQAKGYVGLDIDFEYIPAEDAQAYQNFIANAVTYLHPYGFFVNTDLAPKISATQQGLLYESHDYAGIGAISDTVLLMTYEWGYTYGPPMAVAPINKVREVVEFGVSEIPAEKIIMGIPNYGYDWLLPFEKGVSKATSIGNEYAIEMAAKYGAEIQFDALAQSPYFTYWDAGGRQHEVWFEDVRSIKAKFDLIDEFSLLGAGYWNAMRPFAQNWAYINAVYNIKKVL